MSFGVRGTGCGESVCKGTGQTHFVGEPVPPTRYHSSSSLSSPPESLVAFRLAAMAAAKCWASPFALGFTDATVFGAEAVDAFRSWKLPELIACKRFERLPSG